MKTLPCERCGVCCATGICSYGKLTVKNGWEVCKYLIYSKEDKLMACKLVLNGLVSIKVGIGVGCGLKMCLLNIDHTMKKFLESCYYF